ncbi:MAG: MASE3 domain-containing protein [Phycisphaerae bacterium]
MAVGDGDGIGRNVAAAAAAGARYARLRRWGYRIGAALLVVLLMGALYLASCYSYLLFHALVEMFSIIVACGIFAIVWNSRRFWRNGYFLFLGIGYLFVGGLDLVHTLAYRGMGVFRDPANASNLATQLWVSARYVESLSLFVAPLLLRRRVNAWGVLIGFVVVSVLLLGAIFALDAFPRCYVEGPPGRLTAFKKHSEYAICGIFAASIVLLLARRRSFEASVLWLTISSLGVSILSELLFTLYGSVYDAANMMGHFLKLASFYLIYRAIIHTSLSKPYDLLFRDLRQAEAHLREARDRLEQRVEERTAELRHTVDDLGAEVRERLAAEKKLQRERRTLFSVLQMIPGFVAVLGPDYSLHFVNDRFLDLFGDPGSKSCFELMRRQPEPCDPCPVRSVLQTGRPGEVEWTDAEGRIFHVWAYPLTGHDGEKLVMKLGIDVTEQKRLETAVLRAGELEKERIGQDLHDSLGQTLSGAACLSQVLHQKLAGKSLPEAEDAARIESILSDSVSLTRSLARGLIPVGLEPDSLMTAMRELASNLEEMFQVRCVFRCDRPVLVEDGAVAGHLYRIAQEAANNALRHGKAKEIVLELAEAPDGIVLRVRDDGVGLPDSAGEGGGMGLRIMKYRAEMIGGHLTVARGPEGGTLVACRLRKTVPAEEP